MSNNIIFLCFQIHVLVLLMSWSFSTSAGKMMTFLWMCFIFTNIIAILFLLLLLILPILLLFKTTFAWNEWISRLYIKIVFIDTNFRAIITDRSLFIGSSLMTINSLAELLNWKIINTNLIFKSGIKLFYSFIWSQFSGIAICRQGVKKAISDKSSRKYIIMVIIFVGNQYLHFIIFGWCLWP